MEPIRSTLTPMETECVMEVSLFHRIVLLDLTRSQPIHLETLTLTGMACPMNSIRLLIATLLWSKIWMMMAMA